MGVFSGLVSRKRRKTVAKEIETLKNTTTADIMTKYIITGRADDDIVKAATKMIAEDVSCLIIMDDDKLVGILSERDFLLKVPLNKSALGMKVSDIMTSKVITVSSDTKLTEAVKIMKEKNFRRLVISKDRKVIGVMTQTDLSKYLNSVFKTYPVEEKLTIDQIMSKNVLTATPKESFSHARDKMKRKNVGSIIISEQKSKEPLGIFTEYDVVMQFYDQHGTLKVKDISSFMRKFLVAGVSGMNLFEANRLVLEKKVRRLPIVKEDKVVGIVTQTDIIRFIYLNLDVILKSLEKAEFKVFSNKEFNTEFVGERLKVHSL